MCQQFYKTSLDRTIEPHHAKRDLTYGKQSRLKPVCEPIQSRYTAFVLSL